MIRVRFAPSPTGFLHIGGARTALFNWLYVRGQDGKFILRIEDTDRQRSQKEFLDEILESMKWLGLDWDELYHQSERFDIYREYAQKLLSAGKAYKEGEAVILKMPPKEIKLYDIIRGEIAFDTQIIKDQVLLKSDGSPAYSFACVVDDALMEISHVIRGEDHISNTPKQLVIYEALGFKPPKFAHMPLIMGEDGTRLSKRTGAVAVSDYKKMGFLPEALVNYLMLLGWSPGSNQEIVSLKAAIKKFSIKKINKAAAVFSMDKLKWVNQEYIKQTDDRQLAEFVVSFLKESGQPKGEYSLDKIREIVKLYKTRMPTLADFVERTAYFFADTVEISPELKKKYFSGDQSGAFKVLCEDFATAGDFSPQAAETAFRRAVDKLGLKAADLVHPVRVALTGQDVGPGLFETMAVLGKETTLARLKKFI